MGTKSAFAFPEATWFFQEPDFSKQAFSLDEFFQPAKSWELQSGITVSASTGDVIIFDFAAHPAAIMDGDHADSTYFNRLLGATQARVTVMNAFALCLHSARITEENLGTEGFRVDHRDLLHFGPGVPASGGIGGQGLRMMPLVPGLGFLRPHTKFGAIPPESLKVAFGNLDTLIGHEFSKALELIALLNDSLDSLKNHEFAASLITSWTICEAVLHINWENYFRGEGNSRGVSSTRRKKLNGRDFTASIVSEVLELAGLLDSETFAELDKARKARNNWMHSIEPPKYQDATAAITLAAKMLSELLALNIQVAPSIGASGL